MILGLVLVFFKKQTNKKTDEEIKAQKGEVTCSELHSELIIGLELELRSKKGPFIFTFLIIIGNIVTPCQHWVLTFSTIFANPVREKCLIVLIFIFLITSEVQCFFHVYQPFVVL